MGLKNVQTLLLACLIVSTIVVIQYMLVTPDGRRVNSTPNGSELKETALLGETQVLMEKLEKLIEKVPQPVFSEEKTSNPKLPIPEVTSKIEKKSEFNASLQLRIWIDVPNDFPWRKCMLDYNGVAATSECVLKSHHASTWYIQLWSSTFKIVNAENDRCLQPVPFIDLSEEIKVITSSCGNEKADERWEYKTTGQLEWSEGGCLTSRGSANGNYVLLTHCNSSLAEQRFEFGLVDYDSKLDEYKLWPLDIDDYKSRQKKLREDDLADAKEEVLNTLKVQYKQDNKEKRRAVVFYLDRGTGFLAYLNWWILAWKLLGLNSEKERFDIVLFTHPDSVSHLPKECMEYREGVSDLSGGGKCLFVPLYGISHRDNRYDPYINSHECLVNPNSGFLTQYSHILRADIDTFPTPGIVGFWPDKVLANKYQGYTFRNSSGISKITEALKEATSFLGSKHNGWHDIGSSWFGPSHKILKLSLMTVALSRYLRVYMFGPGTHCRCASCTALPQDCQWGSGPYAGTVLLYAQEIAINLVWTQEEFDSMKTGYLDYGTTSNESVCGMLELHVFHNAEPFSKFSFGAGKYKDYDMSGLILSRVRDYAMYLALKSSGQGVGEKIVSQKYSIGQDGSLADVCKQDGDNTKVEYKDDDKKLNMSSSPSS